MYWQIRKRRSYLNCLFLAFYKFYNFHSTKFQSHMRHVSERTSQAFRFVFAQRKKPFDPESVATEKYLGNAWNISIVNRLHFNCFLLRHVETLSSSSSFDIFRANNDSCHHQFPSLLLASSLVEYFQKDFLRKRRKNVTKPSGELEATFLRWIAIDVLNRKIVADFIMWGKHVNKQ